jgi:hypothetical protein
MLCTGAAAAVPAKESVAEKASAKAEKSLVFMIGFLVIAMFGAQLPVQRPAWRLHGNSGVSDPSIRAEGGADALVDQDGHWAIRMGTRRVTRPRFSRHYELAMFPIAMGNGRAALTLRATGRPALP